VSQLSKLFDEIMKTRRDLSFYLLHCTRRKEKGNLEAFEVLKRILCDGFLIATDAPYLDYKTNKPKPTIEGPKRAVCFTEQPLKYFLATVETDRHYSTKERYTEFAIAVRKGDLFRYGGRPVIYADKDVLDELPDDLKYLFVNYNPNARFDPSRGHRPIDFTHEREWRVCPNPRVNSHLGLFGQNETAVPLQLPTRERGSGFTTDHPKGPRFAILVDAEDRRQELESWIRRKAPQISQTGSQYLGNYANGLPRYWENYAKVLQEAPILSFERINDAQDELTRLEDFINDDFTLKDFVYRDRSGF
jgi:hypothetical protein